MATKALSDFLPRVLPWVEDCPALVAEAAIIDAVIEFCDRAHCWRFDLDAVSIETDVYEYALDQPSGAVVAEVLRVSVDEVPIYPKSREDLDAEIPGWETATGDAVGYFLTPDKSTLRLVRIPESDISDGMLIEVALKPSRAATAIEEFLYQDFLPDIANGAKAILFDMPNEKWSDPVKAAKCRSAFDKAIADASVSSAQSHGRTALRTKPIYSLG